MSLLPKRKTERAEASQVTSFRDDMNRLFDDFFSGGFLSLPGRGTWAPALDVSETDSSVVVQAEVPGMEAKDIDVSITGDTLVIRGEKKEETKSEEHNYYRMERRYGSFQRAVTLPAGVDASKVTASYKHGVLTINMEKKEQTKPRNIRINVE